MTRFMTRFMTTSVRTWVIGFFSLILAFTLSSAHAQTPWAGPVASTQQLTQVTSNPWVACYQDDSQDAINLDRVPLAPVFPFPPQVSVPADCADAPTVVIDGQGSLWVSGTRVYNSFGSNGRALAALYTPSGQVAFATSSDKVFLWTGNRTETVYPGTSGGLGSIHLARNGRVVVILQDGRLWQANGSTGWSQTAARVLLTPEGKGAVVLTNGEIVDLNGRRIYDQSFDPAVAIKIARNGELFWVSRNGLLQSSERGVLSSLTSSGVVAFQVNRRNDVAYLTHSGSLGLNGRWLDLSGPRVVGFQLEANATRVTAYDSEGRVRVFE
jgi:hypothetical protein